MAEKFLRSIGVLAFSMGTLAGCASKGGLITSLEDLATESSKEGLVKVPQYRVVSVPGLLPFVEPGSLQFFKPARKPSSSVGLSAGKSFVMESRIESECPEECLANIRDEMLLLRAQAETVVDARLSLTRLMATQSTSPAAIDTARSNLEGARQELDRLHQEVLKKVHKNGILIYRWNSNSENSNSSKLGNIFGASAGREENYSGFALVSGLRTATLYIGKDLESAWVSLDTKSRFSNRFELTTYVMQAQHIIYVSEYNLQSAIVSKLEASYAELKQLPETLKALDKIEINAAISKVSNLSNMGVIGNSTRATRTVDWTQPGGIAATDLNGLNGWQTFFAVETSMTDLLKLLESSAIK